MLISCCFIKCGVMMIDKKVMIVFGTRPEAIKMCPLVKVCQSSFNVIVCVTGQHQEMLYQVLDFFEITPDYDLSVMKPKQELGDLTSEILKNIQKILKKDNPDLVLVHGDTTTAFSVALAAFYMNIPIGHVEAGLRTYNMSSPFPEEFNRQAVDLVSTYYFAPTECAKNNLLMEGKEEERIYVTGNTGIDALRYSIKKEYRHKEIDWVGDKKLLLVTAHRRENIGEPMRQMFRAIKRVVNEYDNVRVIYPIHLNPLVRSIANEELEGENHIHLIEPLGMLDFHNFMSRSFFVLTDSGGIQEEAPSLGIPVLVMRDTTERPEGVRAGTLRMVGTDEKSIYESCCVLLENEEIYKKMSVAVNPYGDGYASDRIVNILSRQFE